MSMFEIKIYAPTGIKPEDVVCFPTFGELRVCAAIIKKLLGDKILAIHLPARATDDERQEIIALGGVLT